MDFIDYVAYLTQFIWEGGIVEKGCCPSVGRLSQNEWKAQTGSGC